MWLKQSTAVTIRLGPALDKTDGVTEETGLSPSVEVSKNHAAFAARNSASAITHDSNGWYAVPIDATDTGTLGPLIVKFDDAATHLPVWREFLVVPAHVYDGLVAGTDNLQVDTVQWLGTACATPSVAGVPEVDVTHISADATAADNFEAMLDGTGGVKLSLSQLNIVAGSNDSAIVATGAGSGHGIVATGGATGHGISGVGGATSGNGIRAAGTAGNSAAVNAVGQGSAAGILATGGATGAGLSAVGGATSGAGVSAAGTAGNSPAMSLAGQGSAAGLQATGGATGDGIKADGGATSGSGLRATGSNGNANGATFTGQGSAAGLQITGGATGHGMIALGGATSGNGARFAANGSGDGASFVGTTNGDGIDASGAGTGSGIIATGGATGHGQKLVGGGTSGDGVNLTVTGASNSGIKSTGGASGFGLDGTLGTNSITSTSLDSTAVDEILDDVVEGAVTLRQAIRILLSFVGAKVTGGGTTTLTYRDIGDTKNRVTATVDSSGNRSAVTLDGS